MLSSTKHLVNDLPFAEVFDAGAGGAGLGQLPCAHVIPAAAYRKQSPTGHNLMSHSHQHRLSHCRSRPIQELLRWTRVLTIGSAPRWPKRRGNCRCSFSGCSRGCRPGPHRQGTCRQLTVPLQWRLQRNAYDTTLGNDISWSNL
jgi:hypothetical protein